MASLLLEYELQQNSQSNGNKERIEPEIGNIEHYERIDMPSIIVETSTNKRCSRSNSKSCIYFALSVVIKLLIIIATIQCGAGYFLLIKNTIDVHSINTATSNANQHLFPFVLAKSGEIANNTHNTTNYGDNTNSTITASIIQDNYLFIFVFYQYLPIVISSVIIIAYILFAIKTRIYTYLHSIGVKNVIYDLILFSLSFIIFGAVLCIMNYIMLIRIIILSKLNANLKYFRAIDFDKIWSWVCNKFLLNQNDCDKHEQLKRIIVLYYYIINKYYEYKHSEKRPQRVQVNRCKQLYEGKKETILWNYKEIITNEVDFNASCKVGLIPNIDIPFNLPQFNCTIKIGTFGSYLYKYDNIFHSIQLYVLNGSIWLNVFIASIIQHVFIFSIFDNDKYRIPKVPSLSEVFIVSDVCLVLLVIYSVYFYKRYNYSFLNCFKFDILNEAFNKKGIDRVVDELTNCYWHYNDKREIAYILCSIFGENISNIVLQCCYQQRF